MLTLFCLRLEQEAHWFLSLSSGPQKWCAAIKQESARQTWQNHLRNDIGERPVGLALMEARGIDIAFCTDTRESSSEIASRPVNTLSVRFSDSIWRTTSGLRLCANITPQIPGSVEIWLDLTHWCCQWGMLESTCELKAWLSPLKHASVKRTWFWKSSSSWGIFTKLAPDLTVIRPFNRRYQSLYAP